MAFKFLVVSEFLILFTILQIQNSTCQSSNEAIINGTTKDELLQRRTFIKEMGKNAWTAYQKYAWGKNFLYPRSVDPERNNTSRRFKEPKAGDTIIQALPTLWLMNLTEPEFSQARSWVENNFTLSEMKTNHLGPLLSAYALTNDLLFLNRSREIADNLLPEYNESSFYAAYLNHTKFQFSSVEFLYLAKQLRDVPKYWGPLEKHYLDYRNQPSDFDLYGYRKMMTELTKFVWVNSSNNWDSLSFFNTTIASMNTTLRLTKAEKYPFLTYIKHQLPINKVMHQSDCSYGALFALAFKTFDGRYKSVPEPKKLLELSEEITKTCNFGVANNPMHLPPEFVYFDRTGNSNNATFTIGGGYDLSAELAKTYFTLYRVTRDEKYRNYAWKLAQAIEKHCKVSQGRGYAGFKDMDFYVVVKDGQPPEFLGSTLKYLYLIFEEPDVLSLDKWVFTLHGHPIPKQNN